jgi:glyoxylase-like metal-dependent hydrolase (beta-lactamase superfamily II)
MPELHKYEAGVSDLGRGCFAYLQPDGGWGLSNSGLVTDGGEALLIDTMFDGPHTRAMLDAFRRASPAKIGTLVNTHQNGDHWFGNALVDNAEIIATERAASAMAHETPAMLEGFMKAAPGLGLNISCTASAASISPMRRTNFPTRRSADALPNVSAARRSS